MRFGIIRELLNRCLQKACIKFKMDRSNKPKMENMITLILPAFNEEQIKYLKENLITTFLYKGIMD